MKSVFHCPDSHSQLIELDVCSEHDAGCSQIELDQQAMVEVEPTVFVLVLHHLYFKVYLHM